MSDQISQAINFMLITSAIIKNQSLNL